MYIADERPRLYQWDLDRKLVVEDPSITEVHFCNGTTECSLVCLVENGIVCVPNILLQTAGTLRIYGFVDDHTKVMKVYRVYPRTRPDDYVYTETDTLRYKTIKAEVDELRANVHGEIAQAVEAYLKENPPAQFETDDTLELVAGVLSVKTTDSIEADNTLPVTSAAVHTTVGNIEAFLGTI